MRPKDEDGMPLPPPHKRLANVAACEQAAVFAISADGRSAALPLARKLALARKAIDHVVDGDKEPAWVFKKDPDAPENRAMAEIWRAAVKAVREAGPVH